MKELKLVLNKQVCLGFLALVLDFHNAIFLLYDIYNFSQGTQVLEFHKSKGPRLQQKKSSLLSVEQ